LDYRFIEIMSKVPPSLLIHNGETKYILKKAFRGLLPDQILDRPKHGFAVPLGNWLRKNTLEYAREVLLDHQTIQRGLFRPSAVERILSQFEEDRFTFQNVIWVLLNLEVWCRFYL